MQETKEKTPETKSPPNEKHEPRKLRRKNAQAVKLFNELLFEFVGVEATYTKEVNGFLIASDQVSKAAHLLNTKWREYCNHNKDYRKKMVFEIQAFKNSMDKHIEMHKDHAWTKYLIEVLKNNYDITMSWVTAGAYLERTTQPETVAETIYLNLSNMYKIEIPEIGFVKEIPEEISEMSNEDFQFFAGMLHKVFEGELEVYDLKTAMALKYLGVKYSRKDYEKLPEEAKEDIGGNINALTELLDYFFVLKEDKLAFNANFTKNFVPELKLGFGHKLYGPAEALIDITWQEYKDSYTHYRNYLENKDEADLNMMIAILYRPHYLPFGIWKKKRKYNPEKAEKRARKIAKQPMEKRFAVHLFYMACMEYLRTGKPIVDGSELDLSLLYETTLKEKQLHKEPKYDVNTGLAGVALSIAGTGIFGPLELVYEQNMYDVIVLLLKQRTEYLNQLENQK